MAKRYLLGEKAVRQLEDLMPYVDRLKRTTKTTTKPKTRGGGERTFLARLVTTGPNNETNFQDARYWVKEVICSNTADPSASSSPSASYGTDDDYAALPIFYHPVKPSSLSDIQWYGMIHYVAAINLGEAYNSHILHCEAKTSSITNASTIVTVYVKYDQDGLPKYYFNRQATFFLAQLYGSGPSGEPDYTEERYWVRELTIAAGVETDRITASYLSGGRWVTATHLGERYSYHDLPTNLYVQVFVLIDIGGTARYFFNGPSVLV